MHNLYFQIHKDVTIDHTNICIFLQQEESNVTNMVMTNALLMYFWGLVSVQSHRTTATPCHFAAAVAAGLDGCVRDYSSR